MIFYYSDRVVYARAFARSLSFFLRESVELCAFDVVNARQGVSLVLIDGEGVHPQRLKRLVKLYPDCPIVLISDRQFKGFCISAVVPITATARHVAGTCRVVLGRHSLEMGGSLNRMEEVLLERLVQGKSNKEIARDDGLALSTVKYHLQKLYEKMGVNNRTQAALKACETIL